jgi:orotidine-5'-phosphate decarboxylase
MTNNIKKIILALDVNDLNEAKKLIKKTRSLIDIYKIGPILFLRYGIEIIKIIKDNCKMVFLDLKFHDIPNTVMKSVESSVYLGVFSITIHSAGGYDMIKAAVSVKNAPKIWVVTSLTSQIVNINKIIEDAILAKRCMANGVIASPLEVSEIKKICGKDFNVITPGIRCCGMTSDDQKRVSKPEVAIKNGADFIVIGRDIINNFNPYEKLKKIYDKINMI